MTRKRVNLALQGGGAHGAFTWGVLDAFLEDARLDIVGVSGASAGAINAVVLADALRRGGPEAARAELARFWRSVSRDGDLNDTQRRLFDAMLGIWRPLGSQWLEQASNYFSPAQLNPLDINPLRDAIRREIDFAALRTSEGPKLFIAATNVWTGKVRVFERHELTIDMVMASACLPLIFRAVTVEGEPYWDGGYMGNPALFPFFYQTDCEDIVLVQINPIERRETPRTAGEIEARLNEITFNSSLLQEFRAIDFVSRLIDAGRLDGTHYKKVRMHLVGHDALNAFSASTKMDADWDFFQRLCALGQEAGRFFLAENFDAIGERGTLDLRAQFGR